MTTLTQFGTFGAIVDNIGPQRKPLPLLTVAEMRKYGTNFALGAAMDDLGNMTGEVTMVDGQAYLATQAKHVRRMHDFEKVGFVQFANIPPKGSVHRSIFATSPEDLIAQCKKSLPECDQHAFMVRLRGEFNVIDYRGMNTVHAQYDSAIDMMERSPIQRAMHESFTLSGVYQQPVSTLKDIGVEGLHLHGISDDRLKNPYTAKGGHITNFLGFRGMVDIMPVHEWHVGTKTAVLNPAEPNKIVQTDQLYCFPGLGNAAEINR